MAAVQASKRRKERRNKRAYEQWPLAFLACTVAHYASHHLVYNINKEDHDAAARLRAEPFELSLDRGSAVSAEPSLDHARPPHRITWSSLREPIFND